MFENVKSLSRTDSFAEHDESKFRLSPTIPLPVKVGADSLLRERRSVPFCWSAASSFCQLKQLAFDYFSDQQDKRSTHIRQN